MRRYHFLLAALPLLFACDGGPTDPNAPLQTTEPVWRTWVFFTGNRTVGVDRWDPQSQLGGLLHAEEVFGPLIVFPPGQVPPARGEVHSDETGGTYWASAQAPSAPSADTLAAISGNTLFRQIQSFRKVSPTATLRYTLSATVLEGIDANGYDVNDQQCPWRRTLDDPECKSVLHAAVNYRLTMFRPDASPDRDRPCALDFGGSVLEPGSCLYSAGMFLGLRGFGNDWSFSAWPLASTGQRLWEGAAPFVKDPAVTPFIGHGKMSLAAPLRIDVPLDSVPVGAEFHVEADIAIKTRNTRQGESYVGAFLRDPMSAGGLVMEGTGIEAIGVPLALRDTARITMGGHPPVCTPDVEPAGTVQFGAATFASPEPLQYGAVVVTRTGGRSGRVSVLLTTADGSALADVDYLPLTTYVHFEDGEEGERVVIVPLIDDVEREDNETLTLSLSRGDGCGTVGSPAETQLTILDDDRKRRQPGAGSFRVGGTVSGLLGSGLVLRLSGGSSDQLEITDNGPFTFSRVVGDQLSYNVVLVTQPTHPNQVCTVSNGSGQIGGANVTNIEVTCAPPSDQGGLDAGFGSGGKVTAGLPEGARRIALQNDGKIVAVGGRALARYLPSGALDPDFGSGGQVTVRLNLMSDEVRSVAIQPDGKIVVAGYGRTGVNSPTDFDVGVARFHPDGTPDTTFGDQGLVTIDFHGESDTAEEVLIQGDGRIVVAGSARDRPGGILNADYAVLRLTDAGELDTGFGQGGKVMTNIAGQTDLPAAALLQPDGKIVIGGRVGSSGGASPDMALVRYNPDGTLDTGFGAGGIARLQTPGVWDEVQGLALQADGKLIAVGNENIQSQGSPTTFKVVRFNADGSVDTAFGTDGVITEIPFSTQGDFGQAVAVQTDGRIVVAGLASRLQAPDFAIAWLDADGTLDTSFGSGGLMTVDFFGGHDQANAVSIQPDGAILVAGSAVNGASTGIGMVRVRQ